MTKIKINICFADKIFYTINTLFMILCLLLVSVPLINVVSQSLSEPAAVLSGKVLLLPKGINFIGYSKIISDKSIVGGFFNSIFITCGGTLFGVICTIFAAYPLSRTCLYGRKVILWLFTFTMMFSAGLIPTYLLVQSLGMLDTFWSLMLPGSISAWNIIIAKTFFENTIPDELYDASAIDGCSDIKTFTHIVLPLSKPILAIISLFTAVWIWNGYFDAMIYLQTQSKYPLQLILRNIMNSAQIQAAMVMSGVGTDNSAQIAVTEVMKYAVIVVSSLPLLIMYPFIQKYFVKGIMIGAIKG